MATYYSPAAHSCISPCIVCTKVHRRYGNEKAAGSWIKAQLAHWLFHNGLSVLQVCLSQKTEEDLWHSRFYLFIRSSAN